MFFLVVCHQNWSLILIFMHSTCISRTGATVLFNYIDKQHLEIIGTGNGLQISALKRYITHLIFTGKASHYDMLRRKVSAYYLHGASNFHMRTVTNGALNQQKLISLILRWRSTTLLLRNGCRDDYLRRTCVLGCERWLIMEWSCQTLFDDVNNLK